MRMIEVGMKVMRVVLVMMMMMRESGGGNDDGSGGRFDGVKKGF